MDNEVESILIQPVDDPIKVHHNQILGTMNKKEYLETIFGPSLYEDHIPTWDKIKNALNSRHAHITIIGLVLLDIVCVTGELVISFDTKGSDKAKSHTLHVLEDVFKIGGVIILSLFMVELVMKLIFVNKDILKSKLEVFDACIIFISFTAEMIFIANEDVQNEMEAIAEIFAIFRLWRVVRIINGIIMTVEKRAEEKITVLKKSLNALIKESQSLKTELRSKNELLRIIKTAYDF